MSAPAPVVMLPVITDLVPDGTPVTVRVSPPSVVSELEPSVTLPVIVDPASTLTASAPLPVLTLPVILEALSNSVSVLLPVLVSPSIPSVMLPLTEEVASRVSVSAPEPPVIVAVIAVPFAVRASLPSRLLLSLPRESVLSTPPIVALVNSRTSAPAPVLMLPPITDLELLLVPVTVKVSAPS